MASLWRAVALGQTSQAVRFDCFLGEKFSTKFFCSTKVAGLGETVSENVTYMVAGILIRCNIYLQESYQ